jgi:peptidylprolyl isomerase
MLFKKQIMALTTVGIVLGFCQGQADEHGIQVMQNDKNKQQSEAPQGSEKIDSIDMRKLSQAFGNFIGRNLQSPGLKFDMESLINGIRGGAMGEPSPLSEKEYEEMMTAVQEKAFKEMSTNNLKSANDFLVKNGKLQGVKEIIEGKLQYQTLKEGSGATVEAHFSPKIHYTGKYQDGTVFGTSEEMGGPITIPLEQTIPGFSKGILGMKEGEKRRLYVHPDLGYGTSGQLPPNELLIFDIEVIKANSDDAKHKADDKSDNQNDDDEDYDDDEDLLNLKSDSSGVKETKPAIKVPVQH